MVQLSAPPSVAVTPSTRNPPKKRGTKRVWDNFFSLFMISIAYHLNASYPNLFSKRYPIYFWMVMVPLILVTELSWNIFVRKSSVRMISAMAATIFLVSKLRPLIAISYLHAKQWAEHRLDANPSTGIIIEEGMKEGRILIEPDFFDLYLPQALVGMPTKRPSPQRTHAKAGFVLFPGALVEYKAYAGVAKKLSDQGIVVVVFSTENFHRLPIELLGCNMHSVRRAIALLERKYNLLVEEWSVGGHSYGGFTAQQLVTQEPHLFRNAILWAYYRPLVLGDSPVNVLVMQATRDGVGESYRNDPERQQFLDSFARLQGRKLLHDIEGGNHGGFGDYATQTFPFPDKERTISLEEMHNEIMQVTSDFIFDKKSTKD